MTLSFSQKINGQPSYFIEKIWKGIEPELLKQVPTIQDFNVWKGIFHGCYCDQFNDHWDSFDSDVKPKIHTIREDKSNRWKAGMDIHFAINNRSADRFQFAPVIKVKGIQLIQIRWDEGRPYLSIKNQQNPTFSLLYFKNKVGVSFGEDRMLELALNDGFASVEDFFKYFNQDFNGKILHWTMKKY